MARVGIIADTHFPFQHVMYKRFVQDTFSKWKVNKIVHIGDVVDHHAMSFWETHQAAHSAEDEAALARHEVAKWRRTFPDVDVCIGNHDALHQRKAQATGLPARYLKSYQEIWGTPNWNWDFSHNIDGVLYEHGTGTSGKNAALNAAVQKRTSIVSGHVHAWAGVHYHSNYRDRIFALSCGAGIDVKKYAFEYGKYFPVRPMLGCGIVDNGQVAFFVPMEIGRGERYHRSRAGKKRRRVLV